MPSGGARSHSGPAFDENAIRRARDPRTLVQLPEAREGDPPTWPLTPAPSARERVLWTTAWRKPQAVMWEAEGREFEVALFVRTLREAERPRAPVTVRKLLKEQMEQLGFTRQAALRNGWRLPLTAAEPTTGAGTPPLAATGTDGAAPRWTPEVIDGTGG